MYYVSFKCPEFFFTHYITFVPDGEPTLDINLSREVELLRSLGIPLAILTNSSLIWREDVRELLRKATPAGRSLKSF
ncbi:hypothetical protein A3L02_00405 [Thermococcus celer Vu 13 = JCM 8558]|uniref:Uncharacterized protein n=1 Tax=Thermococcus celer Vu 13 = JCM 8558 TaxID=1293037 RepID=A0A218NZR8_THECE|nr:hypothetical protein A3L02_00405 [Thermococcus celer Vu 13 = JCM 8558]